MRVVNRGWGDGGSVTVDAGNFSGWPMRFLKFGRKVRFAGPTSGAMGYSVPAAVSASLAHPDRLVIGFVGDGGFMMASQELATAGQYGGKQIGKASWRERECKYV